MGSGRSLSHKCDRNKREYPSYEYYVYRIQYNDDTSDERGLPEGRAILEEMKGLRRTEGKFVEICILELAEQIADCS